MQNSYSRLFLLLNNMFSFKLKPSQKCRKLEKNSRLNVQRLSVVFKKFYIVYVCFYNI